MITTLPLLAINLTTEITQAANIDSQETPFFDDGVMIRVPVNAFGKTLYFLLDTGFTLSVIDKEYIQNLGDPLAGTYSIRTPLGADNNLPAFHCPKMTIGGNSSGLDRITSLDLKMTRLISGEQCDGILGMDFFGSKVVTIDFDKKLLAMDKAVSETVKKTFIPIPLKQTARFYVVEALINHGKYLELMVDTGDSSSISLNQDAWQEVFGDHPAKVLTISVADAANQVAQSKTGVIGHLEVGNLNYTNLHATLIRNPTSPSHIGLAFFRRHKVTFDFAHRMLYLDPGQQFSVPDKEDMSGLHLIRNDETTLVYSIDEKSPAFNSGIRANDVIETINGQKTSLLTMKELRGRLQARDGDSISLQVNRGGDVLGFAFVLKNPL